MAVREIVEIPASVLATPTRPVVQFGKDERQVARDLVDTMQASSHSVGVAANQIGLGVSAFCLDVSGHKLTKSCHGLIVMFNPRVVKASDQIVLREGCMSVPHFTGAVKRASSVTVEGFDESGEAVVITTNGFEARALLHEIDHLDGKVFLDRVDSPRDVFARRNYK